MKTVEYAMGDIIFREGDDGNSFFQINSGEVGIYTAYGEAGESCLTKLSKDQYFGEMGVIEAYPRSATAVALSDVSLTELTSGELNKFFSSQPDKLIDIMKHICSRIRTLTDDFSEATNVLGEMKAAGEEKSESLLGRIKKFVNVYKHRRKEADRASVESVTHPEKTSHGQGFTGEVKSFSKGTIIFKEGEKGYCMYDVHSGKVGIYKDYNTPGEKLLTELMADEFFGEMGMLENENRSATAVVLDDYTVIESIYPTGLAELFEKNPLKVDMILKHVSYRLRRLTNDYLSVCRQISEASAA